jgi:DnaA family protein
MSSQQLTLNVGLREGFRFDSFYAALDSDNLQTLKVLEAFLASSEQQQNIIWGESLSGKTHLLQACCAKEAENNHPVSYIPLKALAIYGPEVLDGLTQSQLIVVDDVDSAIGEKLWETALFNLINQTRDKGQRLLLSSQQNPRRLDCVLPDLASRLIWGGSYQLHSLSDEEKPKALQARADQRGFELTDRVLEYLFRHYARDIESMMEILNKLDEESLRKKTVITVPFVKQVLEESRS